MLDAVSLDQLRIFVTAADEASFSAAGRRLGRMQSVISHSVANLEAQLGVALFDRAGRYPRLTAAGGMLLERARRVLRDVAGLKAHARSMAEGLEPELSIVVDVMFPQDRLTDAVTAFAHRFPDTPLRLHVEAMGAVVETLLGRRASVGVSGSLPVLPPSVESEPLLDIDLVTVVAPSSPLARVDGAIPVERLAEVTQLVLTDRSPLTEGRDFGVVATKNWRLADLGAKHAFLRAGLGWGHMPREMVARDLEDGSLVAIRIESLAMYLPVMTMRTVFRIDERPGIAGRWLIERLRGTVEGGGEA